MIPTINPWKGLQPYIDSEDDLKLHPFCGREDVVREMFDLIDNNIITTLYGKSGIGKTSLLNAGLFPKLRLEDYIPVYVRLGTDCLENETFAECITRKIIEKTKELDSRVGIEMAMPDCSKTDFLWAFFAKYDFYTKDNSVRYPVVILDQFEEIFNSDTESVKQILLQLQELTSDKLLPDGSPFDVNFRVAISIREDDLYLLEDAIDSYYIPELKANRYRLKPLSKKEAIRVIEVCDNRNISICRDFYDEDQSSDIYESIIRIATGNDTNGGINTQVLSLCCYLLYNKNKNVRTTIRLNDIEELRGNLLGNFYDEATKSLTEVQRKVFEEHLVTENNRRLAWSKSAFFDAICNSKDNPQKESDFLNGEYAILRYVTTHGEKCVELIHDMLASIVAERKLHRKNRERNLRRRLNKMNVLSPEGRRLIDNALEFEPDTNKMENDERFFLDEFMKYGFLLSSISEHKPTNIRGINSSNFSLQTAFDDSKLQDTTIRLEFIDDNDEHVYTSDGIYIIEVKYIDNNISEILFFDYLETLTDLNSLTPVYINGGFCGIRIKYKDGKESMRTYLQWDGEKYLPTITTGGYATVEFFEFDKCGSPKKTTYKDIKGSPCRHREGNFGFLSEYDDDGFEIRRIFINEYNDAAPILSGIYARDLLYDSDTGLLLKETNLDSNYTPVRDKDGYCGAEFIRDIKGRIIEKKYIDEFGKICSCKEGFAIQRVAFYDDYVTKYSITSFYDVSDEMVMHIDGYWMSRIEFDSSDYETKITLLNKEQKPMCSIDGCQELQVIYDKRHWFVGLRLFGEDGTYTQGYWLEYNLTYTHIARMGYLSADNHKAKIPDTDAYALGIREDLQIENLPLLRVYWDENDRPIVINSGYYAHRLWKERNVNWFDENDRTTKELYYDLDGNPMADSLGVFGERYEYDDKQLIKSTIYLDDNGNDANSINGICRIESLFDSNGKEIERRFYDSDGNRCLSSDGQSMIRFEWTNDNHTKTTICLDQEEIPSDKELGYAYIIEEMDSAFPSKVYRRYYKNAAQEIVVVDEGFYIAEYLYDKEGNIIEIRNIGPDNKLLIKQEGYAISRIETINSEQGSIRKEKFLNESEQLVIPKGLTYAMSLKCFDKDGRIVRDTILDANEYPVRYQDGTYGATYEYGLTGNPIIQSKINENGQIMSDNDGVARHLIELDNKGQKVKEVCYDIQGNAILTEDGDYGKRWHFSDAADERIETLESLDEKGELQLNSWGYSIMERRYDKVGHLLSVSFYDKDRQPTECYEQYHITHHEYNEDYSEKIISYYNVSGKLCENKSGISHVFQKLDFNGRVIYEYRTNQKGEIIPYDDTTYRIQREYISEKDDKEWKEYYLDKDDNLCEDSYGVAFNHLCKDDSDRIIFRMRFNSEGNPQADEQGDYGHVYQFNDANRTTTIIFLDEKGNPHVNRSGCSAISRVKDALGRVVKEMWLDNNLMPLADSSTGCCGLNIFYIDNNMEIRLNLDSSENLMEDNDGIAFSRVWKDSFGRISKKMNYKHDGTFAYNVAGYCGEQFIYTDNPNTEIRVYLDSEGNPCMTKAGYMREVIISSEKGTKHRMFDEKWKSVSVVSVVIKALYLFLFKKKYKDMQNSREMAVFHVTLDGQLKHCKIEGDFLLIQYNRWEMGFPMEILGQEIENSRETEKDMVFIRLNTNEDKLSLGDYYHMHFTKEFLGAQFENITIPDDLYQEAIRIMNNHVED